MSPGDDELPPALLPKDEVRERLQAVAHSIAKQLPPKTGFILLAAPFDSTKGVSDPGSRLNYISNIQRNQAVALLKEWLIKAGHEEDWMKHLK